MHIIKNRKGQITDRIELPNQEKIRTLGKKGNLQMPMLITDKV